MKYLLTIFLASAIAVSSASTFPQVSFLDSAVPPAIMPIIGINLSWGTNINVTVWQAYSLNPSAGWMVDTDTNVCGYKIYLGQASRCYATVIDVHCTTGWPLNQLPLTNGGVYFACVTAYDPTVTSSFQTYGTSNWQPALQGESAFSNEAVFTNNPIWTVRTNLTATGVFMPMTGAQMLFKTSNTNGILTTNKVTASYL